jgi:hypothetical protein
LGQHHYQTTTIHFPLRNLIHSISLDNSKEFKFIFPYDNDDKARVISINPSLGCKMPACIANHAETNIRIRDSSTGGWLTCLSLS